MTGSTTNQTSYSYVDPGQLAATATSSPTAKSPTTSGGWSTPTTAPGKSRSWSAEGIPSDAVKVTDEFIWLPDAKTGKVYKRRHGCKSTASAGCRCRKCYLANKAAELRYQENRRLNGGSVPRYDGDAVRAHILWLATEKKVGRRALARMTGIHEASLQRILRGKKDNPAPKTVLPRLAERILAVTGDEQEGWCPHSRVPSDLTIRRLQSLQASGFSGGHIHQLMSDKVANGGSNRVNKLISVPENHPYVWVTMAEGILRVYRMVGDSPAEEWGARKSAATLSRNRAKENGWLPPASWDDPGCLFGEVPDEPLPEVRVDPVVVERLFLGDRDGLSFNHDERREAVRQMIARGVGYNETVLRLHISTQTYTKIVGELRDEPDA